MKADVKSGDAVESAPSRVRIKICGLTRFRDVQMARSLEADYLGFIFAPSPRRTTLEAVATILRSLDQELEREQSGRRSPGLPAAERVGVFVDADRDFIDEAVRQAGLTMLQLHGQEDPEYCRQFRLPVIKALRIRDRGIFEQVRGYPTPYILLEPYVKGKHGGTGVQANWRLAAELVQAFPDKRFFLAGGLGPANVGAAVAAVRPFAVDASSALESSPGIKDRQKMKAFFKSVRSR